MELMTCVHWHMLYWLPALYFLLFSGTTMVGRSKASAWLPKDPKKGVAGLSVEGDGCEA